MNYQLGIICAILGAICAALANIFGKIGMQGISPIFATAIRSVVMMIASITIAVLAGVHKSFATLNSKSTTMIVLSGLAGAASWMFGFSALANLRATQAGPIDKMSVPIAAILAFFILKERPTEMNWIGIGLIAVGAYLASLPGK